MRRIPGCQSVECKNWCFRFPEGLAYSGLGLGLRSPEQVQLSQAQASRSQTRSRSGRGAMSLGRELVTEVSSGRSSAIPEYLHVPACILASAFGKRLQTENNRTGNPPSNYFSAFQQLRARNERTSRTDQVIWDEGEEHPWSAEAESAEAWPIRRK